MLIYGLFFILTLSQIWCFTPNCVPGHQFKFFEFPVEACSDFFQTKCKFHSRGYWKSLGDASPLVKIKETAVVPTCAFFDSESLKQIYGVKSKIKVLAPKAFMRLPNLKGIYLSYNYITEVRSDVFNNVSTELLDLSWNKIVFVDSEAFSKIKKLLYLNLSKNFLVTVPLNDLGKSLKSLNLSYNLLIRVAWNSANFRHLKYVDFSNNAISKVAIHIEYPVKNIDLSNNRLQYFDYLDIQSVGIFKMGGNLFKYVPDYLENLNANEIYLYPNPWNCAELQLLWEKLLNFRTLVSARTDEFAVCTFDVGPLTNNLASRDNSSKSCSDDHECPSSMTCRANKCWDPCKESLCHESSSCTTQHHEFTCSCPPGLYFNPMEVHGQCKKVDCFTNTQCKRGHMCIDEKCVEVAFQLLPPSFMPVPEDVPWWFEEIPHKVPLYTIKIY